MAIQRQFNFLGNMRVDVPHLRLVESSVAADFQALSGTLMSGTRALVAWGAAVLDVGVAGTPASSLLMRMAGAVLLHGTATEPGAIFTVSTTQPDDILNGTNTLVVGSFTPGVHQVNYVSIDLLRLADPATQDTVVFRSASTGAEFTQVVPLGRVLQYRIHISTSDFGTTPTYCPIAKVTVDASGNVESVVDCRQMFWRLGTGGTTPNALAQFSWSNRNEATSTSAFTGGDKDLRSQSDFNRAIVQRLWELGGGEHWYSPATDRTVQLTYDNTATFPATGENWDAISSPGNLLWRGLSFWFADSTGTENLVADAAVATPGLTNLVDGDLVYVELNRTANVTVTPVKTTWAALFALPESTPGSRHILAWRQHGRIYVGQQSVVVNTGGVHATNTSFGVVKLFTAFVPNPANPVVPVMDADSAVVLANPATPANVVARGITRDSAGTMAIATGANDTAVTISKSGAITTVAGTLHISESATCVALNGAVQNDAFTSTGGDRSTPGLAGAGLTGIGGAGAALSLGGNGVVGTGGAATGIPGAGVVGTGGAGGGGGVGVAGNGGGPNGRGGGFAGVGTGSGVEASGGGTAGTGVKGTGGAAGGIGVVGTGGAASGIGVEGVGTGGSAGVQGTGQAAGVGVAGFGGATDAAGVEGTGGGTNGPGVIGVGVGTGSGIFGTGGATVSSAGVSGQGGGGGGYGVHGTGSGTLPGVYGTAAGTADGTQGQATGSGAGVYGVSATGPGVQAIANATRGSINLAPRNTAPTTPVVGDMYCDNFTAPAHFYVCVTAGAWTLLI